MRSLRALVRSFAPSQDLRDRVFAAWDAVQRGLVVSPQVASIEETLDYILAHDSSVVRLGDGEMSLIRGHGIKFQPYSEDLASRLKDVLASKQSNLLVCLPDTFINLRRYRARPQRFFRAEMGRTRAHWAHYTDRRLYYNAFISRPYMDWVDRTKATGRFERIMRIWQERNVTLIEGATSRLGVGNDLFSRAASIQRVLCPNVNAFAAYESILAAALNTDPGRLVLVALGPAAKPLVCDLCASGYQAIDIGHIDIEYEWYLRQAEQKSLVPGKYVNEVQGGDQVADVSSGEYQAQIVKVVSAAPQSEVVRHTL